MCKGKVIIRTDISGCAVAFKDETPKTLTPEMSVEVPTLKEMGVEVIEKINPMANNPIYYSWKNFISNEHRILEKVVINDDEDTTLNRSFLRAGPRRTIEFDVKEVKAAIVTCGGLCPGENNVIRELVYCLYNTYGVKEVYGIPYGYLGFYSKDWILYTTNAVANIHHIGGTVLGSSRGGFDKKSIIDACVSKGINQIYTIGGDGTHRGAFELYNEIKNRKLPISIGCVPKTIDNDFQLIDHSFGFYTAVEEAQRAIQSAKIEAQGAFHGIGLVKLMGRQSGFIATLASLASRDVDYCLIPEVPFHTLTLCRHLKHKLMSQGHAVIVVAEGAGVHLGTSGQLDKSGNPILLDIGSYLKKSITDYFAQEKMETTIKYIDPTYMIRSIPANAVDSIYCSILSQNCVHGVMAGFTGFTVGLVNTHYVYLPINIVTTVPKQVNPQGKLWYRLMESTQQPDFSNVCNIFMSLAEAVELEAKKLQL